MEALDILIDLVRKRDREEYWRRHESCDFPPRVVLILFVPPINPGERARYFTETPRIEIYRQGARPNDETHFAVDDAAQSPCPVEELVSLSHELGHHDSAVSRGSLIFDTPAEEYEEEVRAWARGREILTDTPFSEWPVFDEREHESLEGYQRGWNLAADVVQEIEERVRKVSND